MIDKRVVKAYIDAPVKEFDWLKHEDETAIEQELSEFSPPAVFKTKPYFHQKICTLIGLVERSFALFLDMGTGKSKIVLDIISNRKRLDPSLRRTLIIVPYILHLEGWEEQIRAHSDLSYTILYGSSVTRIAEIEQGQSEVYVLNYAGLSALCSTKESSSAIKRRLNIPSSHNLTKARMNKEKLKPEVIETLRRCFQCIVFDESTAIKNHQTLSYAIAEQLCETIPYRYILTGTPFGKDPHDLWSQMYVVDFGKTLGKNISLFREVFFKSKPGFFGGYTHTFDKKKTDLLSKKLKNKSIMFQVEECLDLPKRNYNRRYVTWGDDGKEYYTKVKDRLIKEVRESGIDIEGDFMKARQATSGFIRQGDGVIEFTSNPKLDATEQLIEEMPASSKIIIFHFFIHTGELISRRLTKLKIKHSRIWSGTKDKKEQLRNFLTQPNRKAMVINETIGAMGLNLQAANYVLFFEQPVAPITRDQAERRIYRPGQEKPCFYFDLLMKDTIDEKIYYATQAGQNLWEDVLGKKKNLVELL